LSKTGTHENPLVPHKKLRQMFVAMTEMRVLDEHISRLQRKVRPEKRLISAHGQEACRVSTAIDLEAGDLVSDSQAGVAMEVVAGTKAGSLLAQVAELTAQKKDAKTPAKHPAGERQMPWIADAEERLMMALGAALSFRTLRRTNVVVAYVYRSEVSNGVWKQSLELAAKFELPVIFVVLPEPRTGKKSRKDIRELSAKAREHGVPGIPVDASDAVALYRVAQESIGRIRGGGGAVLIEGVAWHSGKDKDAVADPIVLMRKALIDRKVASEAWLDGAGDKLRGRIKGVRIKGVRSKGVRSKGVRGMGVRAKGAKGKGSKSSGSLNGGAKKKRIRSSASTNV
jgi:TPP-dependent pyruvate/acetoin dehydrogenase alpha subunit